MKRVDWFDEKTHVPVIDEQVQNLTAFVDAMADGVIDNDELHKQQESVVNAMKSVEGDLNDEQHAKITRLMIELSAYNIMQAAGDLGVSRVVYASSASVYGSPAAGRRLSEADAPLSTVADGSSAAEADVPSVLYEEGAAGIAEDVVEALAFLFVL